MGYLALVLIKFCRIEARSAPQRESGGLARIIRDLEVADRRAAERRQTAAFRQDLRDVAKGAVLAGVIVDRIARRCGIFYPEIVFEIAARNKIVEAAA